MKGSAPLIKAAIASLQAKLPGQIDAFNGQAGNPQLEHPPAGSYFFGGKEKMQAGEFPAVEVAAPQTTIGHFSIQQADMELTSSVVVVVWAQQPDRDMPTLYEKACGYERCALEVLLQPEAFGGRVEVESVRIFRPKPNPETRRFEYVTAAHVLAFELGDIDQRPVL